MDFVNLDYYILRANSSSFYIAKLGSKGEEDVLKNYKFMQS